MSAALLTIDETARYLRVSRRSVERLISRGLLAHVKVGGATRIDPDTLAQWLKGHELAMFRGPL